MFKNIMLYSIVLQNMPKIIKKKILHECLISMLSIGLKENKYCTVDIS